MTEIIELRDIQEPKIRCNDISELRDLHMKCFKVCIAFVDLFNKFTFQNKGISIKTHKKLSYDFYAFTIYAITEDFGWLVNTDNEEIKLVTIGNLYRNCYVIKKNIEKFLIEEMGAEKLISTLDEIILLIEPYIVK